MAVVYSERMLSMMMEIDRLGRVSIPYVLKYFDQRTFSAICDREYVDWQIAEKGFELSDEGRLRMKAMRTVMHRLHPRDTFSETAQRALRRAHTPRRIITMPAPALRKTA